MYPKETRILIVDDMPVVRKIIAGLLLELGFKDFAQADNGASGWEAIHSAEPRFGLVLCDWSMPSSTGLDLLKRVRSDGRFKSLPFLMLLLDSENQNGHAAMQAGATGFIVKPFTAGMLHEKLRQSHTRPSK